MWEGVQGFWWRKQKTLPVWQANLCFYKKSDIRRSKISQGKSILYHCCVQINLSLVMLFMFLKWVSLKQSPNLRDVWQRSNGKKSIQTHKLLFLVATKVCILAEQTSGYPRIQSILVYFCSYSLISALKVQIWLARKSF